jgi:flagellar motor switch protein FliG
MKLVVNNTLVKGSQSLASVLSQEQIQFVLGQMEKVEKMGRQELEQMVQGLLIQAETNNTMIANCYAVMTEEQIGQVMGQFNTTIVELSVKGVS